MNFCIESPVVPVGFWPFGSEGDRVGQTKGFESRIVNVASHVAEGSRSIVQAFSPLTRVVVTLQIFGIGGGPDPCIPVQSFGNWVFPRRLGVGVSPSFAAE